MNIDSKDIIERTAEVDVDAGVTVRLCALAYTGALQCRPR
jgi:hypothetical protein